MCVESDGIAVFPGKSLSYWEISFGALMRDYLINRNDRKGWVACEKPAQE